jgi:hypothetical protein
MSGKLITAKIDVTKIVKSKLFTGQKGTYLDLIIWVNDQPDQYGNDVSIEQKTDKEEAKIYLGNGKTYKPKPTGQTAPAQQEEPKEIRKDGEDDPPF